MFSGVCDMFQVCSTSDPAAFVVCLVNRQFKAHTLPLLPHFFILHSSNFSKIFILTPNFNGT